MQIKVALVEHEHLDITVACVKSCIQGGLAWVAAALALELLRKGKLDVSQSLRRSHACHFKHEIRSPTL